MSTTVDAVIFCEEPVAATAHRAVAGALDWAMVSMGYGLFLVLLRFSCGAIELTKSNAAIFLGMLLIVGVAYGLIWTIAGTETAGPGR